jgi:hypothetical protein
VLLLALVLGLRAAAPSEAPAPGLELHWDAPSECPDRAQLLAAIDATLGEVDAGERRSLRVHGRVRAEPSAGFVVRLELDDGRASTRELRGSSCRELTEAAALVIAMTIDPRLLETLQGPIAVPEPDVEGSGDGGDAATGEPSEDGGGAGEGASKTSPSKDAATSEVSSGQASSEANAAERATDRSTERTLTASPERRAQVRSPEPLRFLGRAQAGVGGGPLPGAAAVLGLAAGLDGRGWRAELSASYWTPRTRTSAANPAVGVRAQLWTLGVHGCGEPRWRTLSFPLCAGILAGAVHARGEGELVARTIASRWVGVALEPGLVWWVRPRLGVSLRAEGHAALARPALRSEPSGTVFLGNSVGGAIRACVEIRVP